MGYLGVKIHEGVTLSAKTKINENGSLVVGFATVVNTNNMLAAFDDENINMEANESNMIL